MGQQRHQMQNGDAERPETMRQERKCDGGAGSKKVDDTKFGGMKRWSSLSKPTIVSAIAAITRSGPPPFQTA